MILPTGVPPSAKWIKPNAFTFIELIIVMAMLSALLAISAPMMSRFFRGQSIRDEARKVVALTEYARSQAVTLSIPIKIWINPKTGEYGMDAMPGYTLPDERETAVFQLSEDLKFELSSGGKLESGLMNLVFQPDGSLRYDSPLSFQIVLEEKESVLILQKEVGAGYRIIVDQNHEQILRAFQ